jgi:ketosteroid isomerase-like protein
MTTNDEVRDLLIRSYEAYDKGDGAFIFNLFHDDIQWTFHSPPEALPCPTRVSGKTAVLAALKRMGEAVEGVSTKLELVVVEDDRAVAICDTTVRQRKTGRVMRYKCAAFHRYRGNKLIEYSVFYDGLDLMQQLLGREIEVPAAYPVKG